MKTFTFPLLVISLLSFQNCTHHENSNDHDVPTNDYFDNSGRADILSGGARMIPITTAKGELKALPQIANKDYTANQSNESI